MPDNRLILLGAIVLVEIMLVQTVTQANVLIKYSRKIEQRQDLQIISDAVIVIPASRKADANDYYVSAASKRAAYDYYGALADYNRAIQLNPTYAKYYVDRGSLKHSPLDDLSGAMADYNKAIKLDPRFSLAYCNRSQLKRKLNDFTGAVADNTKAISLDEINEVPKAEIYYRRSLIKGENLIDLSGALEDLNMAIALRDYPEYRGYSGYLKYRLNNVSGALADYNIVIDKEKYTGSTLYTAKAYYNRGLLKKDKLKDKAGAIDDFRKALEGFRKNSAESLVKETISKLSELGATE
jgi:tetratricopeptide (TPR) repeat protein